MANYTNATLTSRRKGLANSLNIIVEGEVDEGIDLDSPSSTSSAQDSIGSSNGDAIYYKDNQYSHVMPRSSSKHVDENRTLRFVGRRGLAIGDGEDIKSAKGTVRGVKNRVRAGIANFEFHPLHEGSQMFEEDVGKIVIFTTSMRIVRQTFDDCQLVRKIFQNHRVRYEEKDLFMNAEYHDELIARLGEGHPVTLPIIFIDGELIGDVERLEKLNETGELRRILERFEKYTPTSNCDVCGGFRFVPCKSCSGSKKSLNRNDFTDQFHALKCTKCDENGLMKCPDCNK
ncbi:glutaredoxin domain-containing cysteine-rich protein CG12206-like [Apostichopus japonicus]|uniref:glutaredoxin domain-containing cysteine-rich protein CG12206-like n=1 Tax=Stichopus japonicus TaxID=307972 RepID=UPI003AB3BD6B